MVKWKLKLNSFQRMRRLCVCWLRWRMSTRSLWRLQVSWAKISTPLLPLLLPSCLNLPVLISARGIRGKVATCENVRPGNLELAFSSVILPWRGSERNCCLGTLFSPQQRQDCTSLGVPRADCSLESTLNLTVCYSHHHISIGRAAGGGKCQ